MKNLYIIIITVIVACQYAFAQQKYTDKEIGFDKTSLSQMLSNDGIGKDDMEWRLDILRKEYVAMYELSLKSTNKNKSSREQTTQGCGPNIGFDQGFNNWCYSRFTRCPTNSNPPDPDCPGDPGPGNDVPIYPVGSPVCDDIDTVNGNLISLDNSFNDLAGIDLSSFDDQFIRLGNYGAVSRYLDRVEKTFIINPESQYFSYRYAVALEDPNHHPYEQPYFRVFLLDANGNEIPCSRFEAVSGTTTSTGEGFIQTTVNGRSVFYKQPAVQVIDLYQQGLTDGDQVTIVAEVADCTQGAHYGVAYFEALCDDDFGNGIVMEKNDIVIEGDDICEATDNTIVFSSDIELINTPYWALYDNDSNTLLQEFTINEPSYTFNSEGNFRMELTIDNYSGIDPSCTIQSTVTREFSVVFCPCEDCYSFKPKPGENYVLSAWVKEDVLNQVISYQGASIEVQYLDDAQNVIGSEDFVPKDRIIDGWQRIYKEFTIPAATISLRINLKNKASHDAFFDDVRIHPYNSSMKSFVYDPVTQRLMAELDENNYSTFYEYDQEGGLVRVKKETEKGVYTIQETRSKSSTDN